MTIEPRTEAGRFFARLLRAAVAGDAPGLGDLHQLGDDVAELAAAGLLFDAIVGLLVPRRFPPGTEVRELHRYVAAIQAELAPDGSLPARETEAYLRARLGEPYLLTEVDPERMGDVLGHLLVRLLRDVPLTGSDVDDLVTEAEERTERLAQGRRVSTGTWEVLAAGPVEAPESRVVNWSAIARPKTSRWGRADAPRTRPGRYVRALILPDKATRDELAAHMRGTPEMSAAITIMGALSREILRAAFPRPVDLRRVTATLAHVRAGFRADHLPLLEMDAVARDDLGEDAFAESIPLRVRHATRSTLVAAVVQEVPLATREIDALTAAAEREVAPQT